RNVARCVEDPPPITRALHGRDRWVAPGKRAAFGKPGRRYLMATALGFVAGRGNRVEEVLACLRRAVEADATPPNGTFYFMRNADVRSKTRHDCYEGVAAALRAIGAKATVAKGRVPTGKTDVAGMTLGAADLGLDSAAIRVQPGALCEHLTSLGGVLRKGAGQTPLTELIRYGAAGASGTVAEPYTIQAKFPLPSLHLHYRRGASLAEAFYQSVQAPYQLLIVGDPICQPWAARPSLVADGLPQAGGAADVSRLGLAELGIDAPASGRADDDPSDEGDKTAALRLSTTVTSAGGGTAFWELYVDGRMRMRLPSGREASFSAEQLGPGWHELRCVGVASDAIEATTRRIGSLVLPNGGQGSDSGAVTLLAEAAGDEVRVTASARGAERIELRHNARRVAVIDGAAGSARLSVDRLGKGPVRLQAVAEPGEVRSAPRWVTVR
ncbi:MAG: hypothetical protein AAF805_05845, partial [Planctomycetota bacterium]